MSPFFFQPYISNSLPSQEYRVNYINQAIEGNEKDITYIKKKRSIVMKQSSVDNDAQLKMQALYLAQYLIETNE